MVVTAQLLWAIGLTTLLAGSPSSRVVVPRQPKGDSGPATTGTVRFNAALVDKDMQVRPIPLHTFILTSAQKDTFTTRTDLEGHAILTVPPGDYSIKSTAPVMFQGKEYRWNMSVMISPGAHLEIALTNDNATTEVSSPDVAPSNPNGRTDVAASLFTRLNQSVFRVEAGLAHGTGFLIDTLGGVVMTNAHVVEAAETNNLTVVLDSRTRVHARLLARDSDADIAIIQVRPDYVKDKFRIPLQNPVGKAPVVAGERLVAMGFPLHQELTVTSGIASSVRAGAIISDVNINPGNSGGPLLNVDGEAVAVNTFGDVESGRGPGISGSVLVARAGPALAQAAAQLSQGSPPSKDSLPVMPMDRLSVTALKAYADTANLKNYDGFSESVGGLDVKLQTPIQTFVAMKVYENEVARDRKKREAQAGLPASERYSEVRDYRDWMDYVGDEGAPVVSISVVPEVGETGGSLFARMMVSRYLQATYKFKGDVRGVQVFRNGVPVEPIRGGHAPTKVYVENRWVALKDVADQGFYIYDVEMLRPDSLYAPPRIVITIQDLKSQRSLKCLEVPADVIAQAWNDFEGFYRDVRPQIAFHRANAKAAKGRKAASYEGFMKGQCDWPY